VVCGVASSLRSSSISCPASERSRSASKALNVATQVLLRRCRVKPWLRLIRGPCGVGSPSTSSGGSVASDVVGCSCVCLLHRGPQAILVHRLDVALHLLATARRDHR